MNNDTPEKNTDDLKTAGPAQAVLARLSRELIRDDPEGARELLDGLCMEDRVRAVMRFHGKTRIDLIHLSADSLGLVRALPAPELWITIKEMGEEDSISLIRMAAPGQIQHIADLEWWFNDSLDPLAVAYWFMLMNEAGPETVFNWFRHADEELLVSVFSRFFHVYKTDPDDEGQEPWRTFKNLWTLDDVYYLHFHDSNLAPTIERVLSAIRAQEPVKYYGLLDHVDSELFNEKEVAAAQFRNARLADYGFVEFDEALKIYAPLTETELERLEKEAPEPKEKWFAGERTPASEYPLSLNELPPLLGRALSLIQDLEVIEDLRLGFGALVNRVLVADIMDLSKIESIHQALSKTHYFVETGLGRWSDGDPERAAHLLRTQHVFSIFRAGYTGLLKLGKRAKQFQKEGWLKSVEFGLELLGGDGALLEGIIRLRPMYYGGADDKGTPIYRNFRSEQEVQRAEDALVRAQFTGKLFFETLGVTTDELKLLKDRHQALSLTWEAVFLTAAGQAFSGSGFCFAPLPLEDAKSALSLMLTDKPPRRLRDDVIKELEKRVTESLERLPEIGEADIVLGREFVEKSLRGIEDEARELDLETLDPNYFQAMVIIS